ncbi:DUF1850 domain-containing protein [Xanthobacter tagetidis]|nr:DUF1850 domain-containing protein [Xanthobacter tagetidis]MBB6307979.1 hypothetical protein [Xanthobacter tagetidis]
MGALACLIAGGQMVRLGAAFTLAWTHSVQKSDWQEDWRATPDGLVVVEMRVEGSGAGMEPPEGAVLEGGRYVARPQAAPLKEVMLRRSGATADWRICIDGRCRAMGDMIPADADPVTLALCPDVPG